MRKGYPMIAAVMPAALLLWGAYDVALGVPVAGPETDRVVDEMIRHQEARFDRVGSFSRLQRYSVTTDRFGLKAELVARVHRDRLRGGGEPRAARGRRREGEAELPRRAQ